MNAQQLKNSILQMAVQGKLVTQDPNDEPASVLLERIRVEKEKLIKEGKIKKEKNPSYIFRGEDNLPYEKIGKNDPVCIADEVPFEIPDSWEWVRLGTISTYAETKKKINAKDAEPSLWGLDLEDIEKGGRLLAKISVGERKAIGDKTFFEAGDILYSKLRPYLLKILVADEDGICTPEMVPFKLYGSIDPLYIVAYLKSPYVNDTINTATYGIKMPRAGTETMTRLFVPIPPLDEQHRISAMLNEIEPSISKYNEKDQQISALNKEFPELLKKSILQQAVMGKLVPQNPKDEPASVLLERIHVEKQKLIRAGKLKKDKHESIIFRRDNSHYEQIYGQEVCIDDEIPFEIPESWEWARLRTIGFSQTGNTPAKTHPEYFGNDIPFIGPGDIQNMSVDYNNNGLSLLGKNYGRIAPSGSILQVCIGGSIGKAAMIVEDVAFNQQINAIFPLIVEAKYLLSVMTAPYYIEFIKENAGGTATPIINRGLWDNLLVPIAPLNEQKRIVAMIDKLFSLSDSL